VGVGARSRYFRENTVPDAQPWSVADYWEALDAAYAEHPDWLTHDFSDIDNAFASVRGVPVQNDQRRSWWGSYGYRAQHAESD